MFGLPVSFGIVCVSICPEHVLVSHKSNGNDGSLIVLLELTPVLLTNIDVDVALDSRASLLALPSQLDLYTGLSLGCLFGFGTSHRYSFQLLVFD